MQFPLLVAPSTWGELNRAPLTQRNSPRLVAVRSRFGAAWCPKCRPPRRKTPIMGCRGRGGLRFGQNCLGHGVLFAREPAIACANRLYRTSTRYSVSGRGCPRSHQRVNVRISGPTLALAGPGADQRAHVRGVGPACVRAHILGAVSHAIRLGECSTVSTNVAIPTMRMRGAIQGRGELHATFFDSRPDGSYALPPTTQLVAPPMEQSVAYRRHGMVGTVGAGELPPDAQCPHLAARPPAHRARGGIHAPR